MNFKLLSTRRLTLLNAIRITRENISRTELIEQEEYKHGLELIRKVLHDELPLDVAVSESEHWWNVSGEIASTFMHLFYDLLAREVHKD